MQHFGILFTMETWLGTRRALTVAFAFPLAIAAMSLGTGFVTDDYAFRALLHSTSTHAPASWDLFRFVRGDPVESAVAVRFGRLAWWAAPDLKIHFLRPLTSLLFTADDRLFGDSALGYHACSLLWFALLLAGIAALYRRILSPAAATLGLAAFGLAGAHTQAYAWIAARHVVVGGAAVAWALALYARGGRARWLGLIALAVGLTASEAALGAVPLWCALTLGDRTRSQRARVVDCMPAIILGLAYLGVYAALGCGTRGSGGYHDPLADPLGFARLAVVRLPILLGDAALGIPAELASRVSHGAFALVGAAAVAIVLLSWKATRAGGKVGWLALGGLGALLPGVGGYPAGRVLLVPDIAFAAVIGVILARGALAPSMGRVLVVVLAVAHLVWAPVVSLHNMRLLAHRGRAADRVAREAMALTPTGSRAIIIAASDPLVFLYPRGVLAQTHPGAVTCWSVLSAARARHRLTRTRDRAFMLEIVNPPSLREASFDTLFRAPDRPLADGDMIEQCGATIRVAAVRDGRPARIEVSYEREFEDPMLAFLIWRDNHLERFAMPAVGETVDLPLSAGPR